MVKVNCPGCGKSYSLDETKVPQGKLIEIPCPSCKTIIKINTDNGSITGTDHGPELFRSILKESKALPPMPRILEKATEVLSDENAGFKEVGDVLETDQAMATRVLKLANSAYYGLSVPVESVQQASALLGFQTLIELITVVSTSQMMGKNLKGYDIDSKKMWEHSLSVANAAKIIAEKKHPDMIGNAFNAGLIHDSGMIILDAYIDSRKSIYSAAISEGAAVHSAEKKILGFNHAEIASEFFKKWNLPPAQTHAIRYHHHPDESGDDTLAHILHVADYIAMSESPDENYQVSSNSLKALGLQEEELAEIYEETKAIVSEIIHTIES